jgi:hypothetical protein
MLWLIITLVTYFTLAIVYLIDKHLLTSNISDPKIYTIYVSILVLFIIFLAPFTHFYLPSFNLLMLCFAAGISFTACLYFFYTGVQRFEVSRIVPAIGALKPNINYYFDLYNFFRQRKNSFISVVGFYCFNHWWSFNNL